MKETGQSPTSAYQYLKLFGDLYGGHRGTTVLVWKWNKLRKRVAVCYGEVWKCESSEGLEITDEDQLLKYVCGLHPPPPLTPF